MGAVLNYSYFLNLKVLAARKLFAVDGSFSSLPFIEQEQARAQRGGAAQNKPQKLCLYFLWQRSF